MNSATLRHMVIFTLKSPIGSPEAVEFLEEGKKILSSIPVVQNFGVFRQVSAKNDYEYGFSMDFSSEADYAAYNDNPLHVSFVEERWKVEVERFLEIDFQLN